MNTELMPYDIDQLGPESQDNYTGTCHEPPQSISRLHMITPDKIQYYKSNYRPDESRRPSIMNHY